MGDNPKFYFSKFKPQVPFWKIKGIKTLLANLLISVLTIAAYLATEVSPEFDWRASFAGYLVPIFLFLQVVFVIVWGLRAKPMHILLPIFIIVLGAKHIRSTLAIHIKPDISQTDLKIVSYNIRMMQGYGLVKERTREEARAMVNWLKGTQADIICLQEYYNNAKRFEFDFMQEMEDVGYKYAYFSEAKRTYWIQGQLGMIIYSKYPIIKSVSIYKSDGPNNQIFFSDIQTPKGTIRVYDVHLHSLQLKDKELNAKTSGDKLKRNAKSVGYKLRHGFLERCNQVRILEYSIALSPYPVIVCGDFNDLPYSYTYNQMHKRLNNAFEEGGSGFDFSFNGKIPFLRIDNQWSSSSFKVLNFETWNEVGLSDHFPIVGWYQLPNPDLKQK